MQVVRLVQAEQSKGQAVQRLVEASGKYPTGQVRPQVVLTPATGGARKNPVVQLVQLAGFIEQVVQDKPVHV